MATDYEYDVFLSYKQHHVVIDWVKRFKEKFSFWLIQELGGQKPRIFFDKDSIEAGTKWPDKLKLGVKHSKCILCIWTPEYFQSSWCISEWTSFEAREKMLGIDSETIILPVQFCDGEHNPELAKVRQFHDVRDFAYTAEGFWKSEKVIELEDIIKEIAKTCAKMIKNAPPFRDDFPINEGIGFDGHDQQLIRF